MLDPIGRTHGIDPKRRGNITIFYGEPQTGLRALVRSSMRREGFGDVRLFATLQPMIRAIGERPPDLVLVDGAMPDGDACRAIRDLREGRLGSNPFVPTIVMSWQPTQSLVRNVMNCGSDDLIAKPNSPEQILVRIGALAHRRKPFVATSDYIGPDRRADDAPEIPRIVVPNTLRSKALGEPVDEISMRGAINDALRTINEERLRRNAAAIAELVGLLIPSYRTRTADDDILKAATRLLSVVEDTGRRLRGTSYEPVAELCRAMQAVAARMVEVHPVPVPKDLDLLPRLAEAVVVGFSAFRPGQDAQAAGAALVAVGGLLRTRAA